MNKNSGVIDFWTGGNGVVESSFADNLSVGVTGVVTTFDFTTTPEPSTLGVVGLFAAAITFVGRRRLSGKA